MSWPNGPHPRPPGAAAERERLPRAIAARLVRAGRLADAPAAATPATSHPRHESPTTRDCWSRDVFEAIEWRRFEAVVEALFAQAGFATRSQPHGADGGVDIWLHSTSHDDAPVGIVRCRQWMRSKVGVEEMRALLGTMAQHGIVRGQFVTTSDFTADARQVAAGDGIGLHDVDGVLALIASRTREQQAALLAVAFDGEWWRPTCASCGIKLVERTARQSGRPFWGCENDVRGCTTQMAMRHRPHANA
jgi:restriction system protein